MEQVKKFNEHNFIINELSDFQKEAFITILSILEVRKSDNILFDSDFNSIGIDSITFIEVVIALENKFDFEFDDQMLLIEKFPTVKSMVEYIESKINTN